MTVGSSINCYTIFDSVWKTEIILKQEKETMLMVISPLIMSTLFLAIKSRLVDTEPCSTLLNIAF